MAMANEEKRTVIGRVVRVGADEQNRDGKVIATRLPFTSKTTGKSGLDIEVCELSSGKFWQLTVFGEVSMAEVDGFTLGTDENGMVAWTQNYPPLEVGDMISATGPYTLRKFTRRDGKPGEKDAIRIFNYRQQVRIVSLPDRPRQQPLIKAPAPPRQRGRKAS